MRELFASGYSIPGGNGLGSIEASPLDPLDHLAAEIDARTPDAPTKASDVAENAGIVSDAGGAISKALGLDAAYEHFKQDLKGIVVALGAGAVGLILLIFGIYLLTRD